MRKTLLAVAIVVALAYLYVECVRRFTEGPVVTKASCLVISDRDPCVPVFQPRPPPSALTVWMADAHISPAADIKGVLRRALRDTTTMTFIDKSLSGHCHLTNTCARDLRILTQHHNTVSMPCSVKEDFWLEYRDDPEIQRVDMFFCAHGVASCEIYLSFDKPMLIQVTTRYELGRHSVHEWTNFNRLLVYLFHKWPRAVPDLMPHFLTANNLYDKHYVQYFTGLTEDEVLLLPSDLSHAMGGATYGAPTRRTVLIGPRRVSSEVLKRTVITRMEAPDSLLRAEFMGDVYPHYEHADLCQHVAVILLPYQVSFMTFFELYRMNIPLFAPSLGLLIQWHMQSTILSELTWNRVYGHPGPSPLPPAPAYASWPDPNDDRSIESLRFWLAKSDFYTFPHITTFDSMDDLVQKINDIEHQGLWTNISWNMSEFNKRQAAETDAQVRRMAWKMMSHHQDRREMSHVGFESYRERVTALYPGIPEACY